MIAGIGLEALSEVLERKESILKTLLSFIVVLALVIFPAILLGFQPQEFGVIPQVLFSLLLFAASAWLGYSFNSAAAERAVSSRWLPAAEGACKQLITISYIAERIQKERGKNCNQVQNLLGKLQEEERLPIATLAETQCRSCADKIATLKSQVDTSIADWEVFIGSNCTGDECSSINERGDPQGQPLV